MIAAVSPTWQRGESRTAYRWPGQAPVFVLHFENSRNMFRPALLTTFFAMKREPQRGVLTQPRPTAWVYRLFHDRALKGRSTQLVFEPVRGDDGAIRIEIAAITSAPLQGLAHSVILETQAVGLGWVGAPRWGLQTPTPRLNHDAGEKSGLRWCPAIG